MIVYNQRPKGVRTRVRSLSDEVIEHIRREMITCVGNAASNVAGRARANIRGHAAEPHVGLGSGRDEEDLAQSIYIVMNGSGAKGVSGMSFADGVAKATSLGSRDVKRGLVANSVTVHAGQDEVRAKVSTALSRGHLLHEGYWHAKGGFWMRGVPFLRSAALQAFPEFVACAESLVKGLPGRFNIPIDDSPLGGSPEPEMTEEQQMKAYYDEVMREDASEVRSSMEEEWNNFLLRTPNSELRRQKLGKTGRSRATRGGFIETNYWENSEERFERIVSLFNQMRYGRGTESMASGADPATEAFIRGKLRRGLASGNRASAQMKLDAHNAQYGE